MPSFITLRRFLGTCAVLACVVAAPLAQAPRQPFSRVARHRHAGSPGLDLSARRAGDVPHRRRARRPSGCRRHGEVRRRAGDAPAGDPGHRRRRRDAADGRRRHAEGTGLPAARRDRRSRGPHVSRRRHGGLCARPHPADAGEPAGLRRVLGRRSASGWRRCRSTRSGRRCRTTAPRTWTARRSTCRTSA